jgi:hypothetical protein
MTLGVRLLPILLLVSAAATAQQPSQAQISALRSSCRSDFLTHCPNVSPGGSAALQCLRQHVDQVSPPCQAAVNAVPTRAAPPSGARAQQPATVLPPASASPASTPPAFPSPALTPREKMAAMRRACGQDFRAWCRGVPLGGGQAMSCLAENQARLSPACGSVVAEARARR